MSTLGPFSRRRDPDLSGIGHALNKETYNAAADLEGRRLGAMAALGSTIYAQPAAFANSLTNNYAAYSRPYADATSSYYTGMSNLGRDYSGMYGSGVNAIGGIGTAGAQAMGSAAGSAAGAMGNAYGQAANSMGTLGAANQSALGGLYQNANNSLASMYGSSMNASSARDQAMLAGLAGLGGAGVTSIGNLGAATAASLANQAIAAANGYGQMANANYNMMGQLGAALAGIGAAREAAGPQYAKLNFAAGALPSILNTAQYGMQMAPYTAGNLNMPSVGGSFYGDGGFSASGPGGPVASGSWTNGGGGGGWSQGGRGSFNAPPAPTPQGPIGGGFSQPADGMASATSFLDSIRQQMESPQSMANMYRRDMGAHLDANRAATMDPRFLSSVNDMVGAGYGAMLGAGSRDYSPYDAMRQVRDSTREGAGALESGYGAGRGDMSSVAYQIGGIPRSALGSLASGLGGIMSSADGFISPMLREGRGALEGLAGNLNDTQRAFANNLGSRYSSTNDATRGLFSQTLGQAPWGGDLGALFDSPPPAEARDPLAGLNPHQRSVAVDLMADVRNARMRGQTAEAEDYLQQFRNLTAPIL